MKWMPRLVLALFAFFIGVVVVVLWGAYMAPDADSLLTDGSRKREGRYPLVGSGHARCVESEGGSLAVIILDGELNPKAVSIPQPPYPREALTSRISGEVRVRVTVSESGRVMWADAESGHPLLEPAAMKVVCQAQFEPATDIEGHAQKVNGVVSYRFDLP